MTWTICHCEDPDFWVRSIRDDIQFGVERASLERSEVFRIFFSFTLRLQLIGYDVGDMFSCCEKNDSTEESLDLDESADTLDVLLRLLHKPPPPPPRRPSKKEKDMLTAQIRVREYEPNSVIPLPMLPMLFQLADKYILGESVVSSLHAHLLANASVYPLRVYGFAVEQGLDSIANAASKYLLHPPLWTYTAEDVRVVPCVEAYHRLVGLHAFRIKRLREILLAEDIFPHGYGTCSSHEQKTVSIWERARESLAWKVEAGKAAGFLKFRSIMFFYLFFFFARDGCRR